MIHLREAVNSDVDLTFQWANDPETRKQSLNQDTIFYDEHKDWFVSKLSDQENHRIFIALGPIDICAPVGILRFDRKNEEEIAISYTIAPQYRRMGFGELLVKHGIDRIKKEWKFDRCFAIIKHNNEASVKVVKKNKFILTSGIPGCFIFCRYMLGEK